MIKWLMLLLHGRSAPGKNLLTIWGVSLLSRYVLRVTEVTSASSHHPKS